MSLRTCLLTILAAGAVAVPTTAAAAPPPHEQFRVAIYIPVGVVEKMKDPAWLEQSWEQISSQVRVDKVYIESYRSGVLASDEELESVKKFFTDHGVEASGGIAFAAGGDYAGFEGEHDSSGQFVSFTYTDPKQRAYVKHISEVTARHFDEIILDDFFFNNTKRDSDIAAKGDQTWSEFRVKLMDDVSRELVVGAARAVNPKVKVIIKFPNWYTHFQANGYDLDQEPKIFDSIYTGTETRDPVDTDQHLQQYESYQIIRYFNNIAPGRNGGGWVDTYDIHSIDRYAEQLWDTMLAKAPQILLFQYSDLLRAAPMGERQAWSGLETSFKATELEKWSGSAAGAANFAAVAGYSLSKVNAVVGKLGNPIGLASYRPYQSTGEDFLRDSLGMIGIPVETYPEFPVDAKAVLLTEDAKFDKQIVSKIKAHLERGGSVIITSGLLKAIQDKGLDQIAEIRNTGNILRVNDYWGGSGAGAGASLGNTKDVLVPEIEFMTNDSWPVVRGTANGRGAPLLIMDHYSKGVLYVLTIPENVNDLYSLPQPVLTSIRHYILEDLPVQIDAPAQVSLFEYDNKSFVAESFQDQPVKVTVIAPAGVAKIRNLVTGETALPVVAASLPADGLHRRPRPQKGVRFQIEVAPHSFAAFAEE